MNEMSVPTGSCIRAEVCTDCPGGMRVKRRHYFRSSTSLNDFPATLARLVIMEPKTKQLDQANISTAISSHFCPHSEQTSVNKDRITWYRTEPLTPLYADLENRRTKCMASAMPGRTLSMLSSEAQPKRRAHRMQTPWRTDLTACHREVSSASLRVRKETQTQTRGHIHMDT